MPDDDVRQENIRLRQELEALRSLLQKQATESVAPALSEPERSEDVTSNLDVSKSTSDVVLVSNYSHEKELAQENQKDNSLTLEVDTCSYFTSSCSSELQKPTFAWSWQDECGIWREYDPDICAVPS